MTIPTGCTALAPSDASPSPSGSATPTPPPDLRVDQCYTVSSGSYTYNYVNVVDRGQLIFVDDGGTIDFRASSILVEQGGSVQAGSLDCPFGSANGKLEIGPRGTDPTEQGTNQNPAFAGITCVGNSGNCYDPSLTATPHYCLQPTPPATPSATWSPSNPCDVTVPSNEENTYGNAFFEGYEALNFDYGTSYFGYKVFAVSYGGSLQLFGRKGVADTDLPRRSRRRAATPRKTSTTSTSGRSSADRAGRGLIRPSVPDRRRSGSIAPSIGTRATRSSSARPIGTRATPKRCRSRWRRPPAERRR